MMDNYVITISRGYGSGGREIGRKLAESLGIGYYDREILKLASVATGIDEELFKNADERIKSATLSKIASNVYRSEGIDWNSDESVSNDNLFRYQAKVISELAKYESFVIIGRCADYILRDKKNVLKVFIRASVGNCIKRIGEWSSLSEQDLHYMVLHTDMKRAQYYYYYTHRAWSDANNYDLCVNTDDMTQEQVVDLIKQFLLMKNLRGVTVPT